MTPTELREQLKQIHTLWATEANRPDVMIKHQAIIKEITDGGWTVGVYAYRNQIVHQQRRQGKLRRLLKQPRWEWRNVGHWFKDCTAVFYYNNSAFRKEYAIDMTRKEPVPDWFKQQVISSSSNPKLLAF